MDWIQKPYGVTPHDYWLKKNLFFLLGFVKDNDSFPHLPMTVEELKIRITKAFLKVYPDIPQNGWQELIIDLTLLESLVALTLNFTGWSQ
jgi:hypothetical protein